MYYQSGVIALEYLAAQLADKLDVTDQKHNTTFDCCLSGQFFCSYSQSARSQKVISRNLLQLDLLQARCPSCCPTSIIKAIKELEDIQQTIITGNSLLKKTTLVLLPSELSVLELVPMQTKSNARSDYTNYFL